MYSTIYRCFFERIPSSLINALGNGCIFGDKAYSRIRESEPRLFESVFSCGLRSRIHDKAIQFYLSRKLGEIDSIQIAPKDVGFGNRVLYISGKDFLITPCHIQQSGSLPSASIYKCNAAKDNPGSELTQLSLFSPPVSKTFLNVYFVLAYFFNGASTVSTIMLPDNNFSEILESMPVFKEVSSEEETVYQERIMPKLIFEVEKEHEQGVR